MTMQLSRRSSLLAVWVTLVLAGPSSVNAQQDSARLAGTVRSSIDGRPLSGVMMSVRGARIFDVSDSAGLFALAGLPSGRQTLRIRYGDSLSYEHEITLRGGKTLRLAVFLDVAAVQLAPIVVEAQSVRFARTLAGFYERKKMGFGRYYTYEDLSRRGSLPLRTLFSESGVQLRCGWYVCVPVAFRGARYCQLSLYLDGWLVQSEEIADLRADDLAGMEVYFHGLDVPLEFRRGVEGDCGAVLMWRRYER